MRRPDAPAADSAAADSPARGRDGGSCPAPSAGTLYVDASAPAGGNGSSACPFRTITSALLTAMTFFSGAGTIDLAPGSYDGALGEKFPIYVPPGVTIAGETGKAPSRLSFLINGAGADFSGKLYTIKLAGSLRYVEATDTSGTADAIVYLADACAGASLSLTTISGGNSAAIEAFGQPSLACSPTLTISAQTEIIDSKGDGLLVNGNGAGFSPTVTVKGSLIHTNGGDGVDVLAGAGSAPTVLLGDSCVTLPPITTPDDIYCNGKAGVFASSGVTVQACDDSWNHDPPTTTGANVDYQGSVTVTGYRASVSGACP